MFKLFNIENKLLEPTPGQGAEAYFALYCMCGGYMCVPQSSPDYEM